MPNFDKLRFTSNGLRLQTAAQSGKTLRLSKIEMGSGSYNGDITSLTGLVNPVLESTIIAGTLKDNVYTVEASFTNENLATGFYWNELGLFAIDENGDDVLYAYTRASEDTDYIPSKDESGYLKRVKIAVAVGNATNIEFVQSEETFVDVITFTEKMSQLNTEVADIKSAINNLVGTAEFNEAVNEINEKIDGLAGNLEELEESLSNLMQNSIGNTDISKIGGGTLTGAILAIYNQLNDIPAITSGTTEPTGGEDGDVYIMYEK